jgi:carnitine O-acetyltransferase
LIIATKKHIQRANECRTGNGIYTHFLGLESRYKAAGKNIGISTEPEIFTDAGYQRLINSVVCTSTTSEYGVELAGYGPIVDDGYGIRYFIRKDEICFNLTSRTALKDKLDRLCIYIQESLLEMAELMSGSDT